MNLIGLFIIACAVGKHFGPLEGVAAALAVYMLMPYRPKDYLS